MLLDWLDEAKIDRAGCFKYEPVRGARSNDLGLEQVPQEIKEARWNRFMARQQKISAQLLQKKVGKRLPVLIDEANGTTAKGRSKYDAPEIDGTRAHPVAPTAARRRDRHGQDRPRRRLRPARTGGLRSQRPRNGFELRNPSMLRPFDVRSDKAGIVVRGHSGRGPAQPRPRRRHR